MPVTIMMMGIVFNVLNGMMQAGGLFYFASEGMYSEGNDSCRPAYANGESHGRHED